MYVYKNFRLQGTLKKGKYTIKLTLELFKQGNERITTNI